jgi:hypothetical protein
VPIVNGLAKEFDGRLKVVRVNVRDTNTVSIQEEYGFTATPELFLVDESGKILGHWDEVESAASLAEEIDRLLTDG